MTFEPRPFVPASSFSGPDAQTIAGALLRSGRRPPLVRERWITPDGDFLDLDLVIAPAERPHVLVLHGLEGSSEAGYVSAVLRWVHARGWGACALNFRSCSEEPNRLLRSYHSGETGDALFVIDRWRPRFTGPLFAVGFSLGGNVLLRLLAETGDACPIDAAAAVSVPFDLGRCARGLDSGHGWMTIYRKRFLRTLKRKALAKAARFPGQIDAARVRRIAGIEEFDDKVTAPIHGFSGAAEYYARCSSGPVVGAIRRPTFLLSSTDDPLVPGDTIPKSVPPNVVLHATSAGGHVGFIGGSLVRPEFYGDDAVMAFLTAESGASS